MFVRWKKRQVTRPRDVHRCRHGAAPPVRLTPVVLFSYRGEGRAPKHQTIWRPGVSINACCITDVGARKAFWDAMEDQFACLAGPCGRETSGAVLLNRLDWLRAEIAVVAQPATDAELAGWLEDLMRGPRRTG